ncbi:hypothetical protein TPR58_06015 [Sphingomonas sp. HF-S3]|uniref:Serine kinase n=1 Tax=Sphingomonas rustica TaxID=3103142 RepID=A0ABV0B6V2_9SPHN
MSDYHLFGWRVRSALRLPDLLPWQGDAREPDIVVEIGAVPPLDPELPSFSPAVQIQPAGVRVTIPAVADYWVEAGRRIVVQTALPLEVPDIRVFLLGSVLAILCFQRGVLPLHASGIDIGGRVLLISGNSGAGKSTLAAAFAGRGYRLLSDDLCALDVDGHPGPRILPAFPRVKLWRDSARQLAIATGGLERSRAELEKYHVPVAQGGFQLEPLPPAHVLFLRSEPGSGPARIRAMSGLEALRRYDLVHRWRLGLGLGKQPAMFRSMARLVEAATVAEVTRSDDFAALPALVDTILASVGTPPP